jgi:uncharacterized cupredoxin-like copper-binding protein
MNDRFLRSSLGSGQASCTREICMAAKLMLAAMNRQRRLLCVTALSAAALVLPACAGGGSTVEVELQEFAVVPSEATADAGEVTFELENTGEETHEFVAIRTDLGALDLPTAEDGSVDEEGSGIEVVDEVEEIPSGESRELSVDLDTGNYVLICNIVEEEDGETESHYQEGMRTEFTVE